MKKLSKIYLFLPYIIFLSLVSASNANTIETPAKFAILFDYETNRVLLEKNADLIMYPASMSKLMTAYVVFNRLANNEISLKDTFRVSEKAWRKGGSRMFVELNTRVTVEDLLRGMIIQSGNDASIVLAEGISGSEEIFSSEMNFYAKKLGLENTNFRNATGWPDSKHYTSARDLIKLANALIYEYPQYLKYYSELNFTYNNITQGNRNPLLYKNLGADGLKTGHTSQSGYGLVASVIRAGRRVLLVINGLNSTKQRSTEAERLIDWSFRNFDNYTLFKSNQPIKKVSVWLGKNQDLALILKDDLVLTLSKNEKNNLKTKIVYNYPIEAPIRKGEKIGKLIVEIPSSETVERDLLASKNIDSLTLLGRIKAKISYLIFGDIKGSTK
tara:strand:- start:970 stop:2127 length:1158 start_codon:yes stop_codon:yes gene_type:complete